MRLSSSYVKRVMDSRADLLAAVPMPPIMDLHVPGISHGPFDADADFSVSELNRFTHHFEEKHMSLGTILLIVLILMLIGVIPTWPHSRNWGYWPSGGLGLVVIIIIVLLLMGRL